MKHNIRDPKTGRFIKKSDCNCEHTDCYDNDCGCGCCSTTDHYENDVPEWKIAFDKAMKSFNESMAKFNEIMSTIQL